ncbi:hypothetical protein BJB45_06530 [Halomonas huangheensis]|uniref:Uncharacterized protein n=1 Tax=Halomonas huangheensis TaxID=1178482 RepID=W1N2N2_9GAMM|nr:hypothetical protein BJB45_06530 [Halomonas huangheensis]
MLAPRIIRLRIIKLRIIKLRTIGYGNARQGQVPGVSGLTFLDQRFWINIDE